MTTHDFARLVEELMARRKARRLIAGARYEQILRLLEDIHAAPNAGYGDQ
ncbi:MAG: hypothetical protein AAF922_14795 [Pseudomonadota bacterium]